MATGLKYFIYARKSSESDEKQVSSIKDQIIECKELADRSKLNIVEVLSEAKSGSTPGRLVFNDMMKRIREGKADGIVCWHLNRLSRNPIDSGVIQWMLQQEVIKEIVTPQKVYLPEESSIVMAVESGSANQYSRELSYNVKRGKNRKAKDGKFMGHSKYGFIYKPNVKQGRVVIEEGTLLIHPEQSKVVRKIFDMAIAGQSMREICVWLRTNNITKPRPDRIGRGKKRLGATVWSQATISGILSDEMYAGTYYYGKTRNIGKRKVHNDRDKWIPVSLPTSIVTPEEFLLARKNVRMRRTTKARKRFYLIRGLATCGYCGYKLAGTTSGNATQYYRCGSRWLDYTQASRCEFKMAKADHIDDAVLEKIKKILNNPQEIKKHMVKAAKAQLSNQKVQKELAKLDAKLDRWSEMYAEGDVSKDKFRQKKGAIQVQIEELKKHIIEDGVVDISPESWAMAMKLQMQGATKEKLRSVLVSMVEKIEVKNDSVHLRLLCGESSVEGCCYIYSSGC